MTRMASIFAITPSSLGALDGAGGTLLLRDLLWCEAGRANIPPQNVIVSMNVTAKDGGIDAKVQGVSCVDSLLTDGDTYFQLKAGKTFKPWQRSEIRSELFGKQKPGVGALGDAVRRCLREGGRYVLVTLGHDLLPEQHSSAVALIREYFTICGYPETTIEVIGQGQICGYIERYPSLASAVAHRDISGFFTVDDWRRSADMTAQLCVADAQTNFLQNIRGKLADPLTRHVRVIGEPGIGKTRLVLEAVSDDSLRPRALYVPHADNFQKSSLFNEFVRADRDLSAVLVIDECDEKNRASIWNALKNVPGVRLVTIDHGPERSVDAQMAVLVCPTLHNDQVAEILSIYVGNGPDLGTWAEWCSGSPRVAHAVGENLAQNPDDILKPPATVPIWQRFVLGYKERETKESNEILLTLRHVALFQRFGFESPVSEEGRFIASLISEADPAISWARFQSIIQEQRGRRVLQGRHTLFLVPKALHVQLWLEYWHYYGRGFDFKNFVERLPKGLRNWFFTLFPYAHAEPVAQEVVKKILDPNEGPFSDEEFLESESGARFLSLLAEADPEATLKLCEGTYGKWTPERIERWTIGRQHVVWALEKIAVWEEQFERAVRLLVHLALGENASNSNNSKGTLLGLFQIGRGWAPTQAPPEKRLRIIQELLTSKDPKREALAVELCGEWLTTHGGFRVIGVEYQGARPAIRFWRPTTYEEVFGLWRQVIHLLLAESENDTSSVKMDAVNCLIESASGLIHVGVLADEIIEVLEQIERAIPEARSTLIAFVLRHLGRRVDGLAEHIVEKLKRLDAALTGTTYAERLDRFVVYSDWHESHEFQDGELKESDVPVARINSLADEFFSSDDVIEAHLDTFLTLQGHRVFQFAAAIGERSPDPAFDDRIFERAKVHAQEASSDFLAGYLAGVRKRDSERWEKLLVTLLSTNEVSRKAGMCLWSAGINEPVLRAAIASFQLGEIDAWCFKRIGIDAAREGTSQGLVEELIDALIGSGDNTSIVAGIEVADYYFSDDRTARLGRELGLQIITSFDPAMEESDTMAGYHWHSICGKFRSLYPDQDAEILRFILTWYKHLTGPSSGNYLRQIADEIIGKHPYETWVEITRLWGRDNDAAWFLAHWLADDMGFEEKAGSGLLSAFPTDEVMKWLREDPEERRDFVRVALPKTLDPAHGGQITQAFIEEFSNDPSVGLRLRTHFHMGGWSGPESLYLSRKRDEARKWLSMGLSPGVRSWVEAYIRYLGDQITACEIAEEREVH